MTSRLRPWGPPADSAAGSQTREEALNSGTQSLATLGPKGGLRSLVLSWAPSWASLRLILLLTAGGIDPAASPSHPTPESCHPDLTPDPNNEPLAPTGAAAAAGQATRPRCPSPPTQDPPARLDRRKAFLWEPPGCHVRLPYGQSRLRAASSCFLAAHRPRLLRRPRPFPAAGPRVRGVSGALPGRRALPGGRGGGAGAEAELAAEKEAAPG